MTESDCPFALMCYTAGVKYIQLVYLKGYVDNTDQCKNARDEKDIKHRRTFQNQYLSFCRELVPVYIVQIL